MIRRLFCLTLSVLASAATVLPSPQAQTQSQTEKPKSKEEARREAEAIRKKPSELPKQISVPRGTTLGSQVGERVLTPEQQTSQKAVRLADVGDFQTARREVEDARAKCSPDSESKTCHATLTSTMAYLSQREGTMQPSGSENQKQLLRVAAELYRKVLSEQLSTAAISSIAGPALNNLAQIEAALGNPENAQVLYERAIKADPGRGAYYAVQSGDLYVAKESWQAALRQYNRAATRDPQSNTPKWRILNVYRNGYAELPKEDRQKLPQLLATWETLAPDAARLGYEFQMERFGIEDDNSVVNWAMLLARRGMISQSAVASLSARIRENPAVRDLGAFLENPWRLPPREHWWVQNETRRWALADVALAWGRLDPMHNVELVEQCWNTGLEILGDRHRFSLSIPQLATILELRRELASLYASVPKLDSKGSKLQKLVIQLVEEKAPVIASGNLQAQQKYHTVLGLIFADRNQWDSEGGFDNARYQIEHALEAADKQYRQTGFYQPLPELQSLLATEFGSKGDSRAASKAIEAARAYADSDDLGKAIHWIEEALKFGANKETLRPLRDLIQLRSRVASRELRWKAADVTKDKAPILYNSTSVLPGDFLDRQRFKLLAEIALPEDLTTDWDATLAVQAWQLATKRGFSLVGGGDLRRLQTIGPALLSILDSDEPVLFLSAAVGPGKAASENALRLALPGDPVPSLVELSPVGSMLTRILLVVRADDYRPLRGHVRLEPHGLVALDAEGVGLLNRYRQVFDAAGIARAPAREEP